VKYVLLMYADPAQTKAMTAQDRDTVARKHAALLTELINPVSCWTGPGWPIPRTRRPYGWKMGRSPSPKGHSGHPHFT
jgi:hypothetical protein